MRKFQAYKILEKVRNDYDQIAEEFAITRDRIWDEFKFFKEYIKKNDSVLDLGCGNGRLILFLNDFGVQYFGVDNSENLLKTAKKRFPEFQFLKGDMLKIPFEDNYFDSVFCIAAFHHLPTLNLRLKALFELKRVLKPGGDVIMTNWNLYQDKYKKVKRVSFWKWFFSFGAYSKQDFFVSWGKEKKIKRYYYAFKEGEVEKLFEKAGFEVVESFSVRKGEKVEFEQGFNICSVGRKK